MTALPAGLTRGGTIRFGVTTASVRPQAAVVKARTSCCLTVFRGGKEVTSRAEALRDWTIRPEGALGVIR